MTIHDASQQLRFQLFHLYDEREAGNITALVMEHLTGWQKIDRVVNKTVPLTGGQIKKLEEYTAALLRHTPLQYVLQEAWFYGMKLYVDENVLIPRPETEELVDWLIKTVVSLESGAGSRETIVGSHESLVNSRKTMKNILDIGTGSGCIPLAIKKNLPLMDVHTCDISEGALLVAKKNATEQKLHINFHQVNILSATERNNLPVFDIIISNPPYIPQADKASMANNVLQYEPHLALFVENNDPLLFYAAIADFAKTHLTKVGSIYLEIHEEMGDAIINLYKEKGFTNIELKKDMQERDRMMRIVGSR